MSRAAPRFLPILPAFAARVAGRAPGDPAGSGAALARALADARTVVGHDGVLCHFDAGILVDACLAGGGALRDPESIADAPPLRALRDAIEALGALLGNQGSALFTLCGPALLHERLRERLPGAPLLEDGDYAGDVFTAVLRVALESGAHGVALIDHLPADAAEEFGSAYRSARKLADFYARDLLLFLLPGSALPPPAGPHCCFLLPAAGEPCALLPALSVDGSRWAAPPYTTAGAVPADTPVETLRALCAQAFAATQATPGGT